MIVFTSRPYERFTPARFARIVRADRDDEILRLQLELGSRARTTDPRAWQAFVAGRPNPSEASEVWVLRLEEDGPTPETDTVGGAPTRPPVTYADPAEDERAWRDTIAQLAPDEDYRTAVFLRVASIRGADEAVARTLEPPYRLGVERAYLVRLASFNPHLTAEALRGARLLPVYDELATAVVLDDKQAIPDDGALDVLVSPIVAGPGWLEFDVALGLDVVAATSVGWVAEGGMAIRPDDDASALPEVLELPFAPPDAVAEAAVRAYAVAEEARLAPELRLRLIAELRAIAPEELRLAEGEGLARYEAGDYEDARTMLAALPPDALGVRGRATLIAAILRTGSLPDPIERVRIADLWRPEAAALVLAASAALSPEDQLRLAGFVAGNLLSEERASDWYGAVSGRDLPAPALARLLDRWSEIDPERAAAARAKMPRGGRP